MTMTPSTPKTGLAVTSLILGILACCCFGFLTGIPAVILGIVVLSRTSRDPARYTGRGMGIAGIVTGSIGSALCVIFIPLYIAILLPSLGRARELANRSYDAASLRQLGVAFTTYATDNAGAFPPSIAAAAQYGADPKNFISKDGTTTPPAFTTPVPDWHPLAADIEAHTDFIYTGADLHTPTDPAIILLYTKDVYMGHEGRNLLFTDGHVEYVRSINLPTLFGESNTARERLHLPPITLDGPPPTPNDGTP
jgi:prepilin-type processing-associated H-X9-DG protein